MAYDKPHKFNRRNDRNAKVAQRKVFAFSAASNRDHDNDDEMDNRRNRFY